VAPPLHCSVFVSGKVIKLGYEGAIAGAMSKLLTVLVLFVASSWQQKDPLSDFCRRFAHQTTVVDQKLFIDGGQVDWNPISQNDQNYTSEL
jgi:hypothetical protein